MRSRAPSPDAPLIERARYAALQFSQKLPNFICEEYMARYGQRGQDKRLLDIVSAEVTYNNGQESYGNVKLDQHPTDKGIQELNGSWSVGEFASTLLDLFSPYTDAQFQSRGASPISGLDAQVYDFRVPSENSHWRVQAESQTLRPAYKGSVWVDPATARVLRIEMQATNLPSDFPMDTVESAVDYSYVTITGNSFCFRSTPRAWAVSGAAQRAVTTSLISAIITNLKSTPRFLALSNNGSFAATNEREGPENCDKVVRALLETGMKVFYLTHLYEFARRFFNEKGRGIFLRAERAADGRQTFKLVERGFLQTRYGQDLYNEVFGVEDQTVVTGQTMSR